MKKINVNDLSIFALQSVDKDNNINYFNIYYAGMDYGRISNDKIKLYKDEFTKYEDNINEKLLEKIKTIKNYDKFKKMCNKNGFIELKNI